MAPYLGHLSSSDDDSRQKIACLTSLGTNFIRLVWSYSPTSDNPKVWILKGWLGSKASLNKLLN